MLFRLKVKVRKQFLNSINPWRQEVHSTDERNPKTHQLESLKANCVDIEITLQIA